MNNSSSKSRFSIGSRVASVFLSAALMATTFTGLGSTLTSTYAHAASSVDFMVEDQQYGSILQCFNWSFDAIRQNMATIAEQGFTAVQTSPIQTAKEGTAGKTAKGSWWVQYQPADFTIETNANGTGSLGTATEFKAMCDEAHKYGVRVIVDAVLNHMANQSKNDLSPKIPSEYRNNSSFWHDISVNSWYQSRYDITQYCMDGVPDLNTGSTDVQNAAIKFLKECIDCGADGFRFDGAKHIETPADSTGSQFWPNVLNTTTSYAQSTRGITPYYYGEVLDKTTGDSDQGVGQNIVNSYTSYMSITMSDVSNSIRNAVNSSNASGAKRGDFNLQDGSSVKGSRAVLWNESHDTYQAGSSSYVSDYNMNKTWAMVGARAEACGMYMARPSNWSSAMMGQGDVTAWANAEVKAVNDFNNAFIGQSEYLSASGNIAYNERGTTGVVLVNLSGGSTSVSVTANKMAAGTYKDKITGNTFTVSGGTISGQIGDTGIAVVYNDVDPVKGSVSASPDNGTTFNDTLTVTLNAKDVTSPTYTTSEGKSGTYTNGQTITVGSSTAVGSSVTVTVSGTNSEGKEISKTYKYTKKDPNASVTVYFDNSKYNWSSVYAYIYTGSGSSAVNVKGWPGTAMSKGSSGFYELQVPDGFENGKVIFTESSAATTNRYPADQEEGLSIGGTSMKFSYGNVWETYVPESPDPTVTADKASGTSFSTETMDITLTLSNAVSGTYIVDDGIEKSFTGSAKVTIGEGKIGDSTVTVKTTAKDSDGNSKSYTFTYEKKYVVKTTSSSASLASYYSTNAKGYGANKTISVDGDLSDWDSSMLIAQGTANDDPRVYRPDSMYEVPLDLYALYGAYDDTNLYLMWEMTNVQDVVAPIDNYPLSQGTLWQTQELPFFIAVDTGKSDAIGNNGQLQTGGTIWNSGMTIKNSFNRLISINTKGGNGPFVYEGDSTGLNSVEVLDATTSKIKMKYGQGILSKNVYGIDGAYGTNNGRVVGDMCNESAAWVDFNTKGHASASMDFFYELSIPLSELGVTKSDIADNGIGVLLVMTSGKSGMDCLPYDLSMNDNADLDDAAGSQEKNSFEKSDEDFITTSFARIGKDGGDNPPITETPLQVNFGTDRSAPQLSTTKLTLKGIGYGGTAPYKYTFYVDGKTVKSSSTTDTYSWTPATEGKHTIKCVITDSTGATATTEKTFTSEGGSPYDTLTVSAQLSATSIPLGSTVTVNASAAGGDGTYTYAVYYRRANTSSWTTAQGFKSNSKVTITPAAATNYEVCVKAHDGNGTEAKEYYTFTVSNDKLVNTSKVSSTSVALGDTVTITGSATGGSGIYSYAVYYKETTASKWTELKAYSTTKSISFKPAKAVSYDLCVKVKDGAGTVEKSYFTVDVTSVLKNTSKVSSTSVALGDTVTITGSATGGTGTYNYAVYYKETTASKWTEHKAYSTTKSISFKPAKAVSYDLCVKVKDGAGTVEKAYFTVAVKSVLTNNSTLSSTSITLGSSFTVKGAATGGTGYYNYAVYYRRVNTSSWTTAQSYQANTTVSVTPLAAVDYDVCVKVKDSNGTEEKKYFVVSVTNNTELSNTSTVSSESIVKGSTVTVKCAATGGSGSYTYAVYYKKLADTKWTEKQAFNSNATVSVKPAHPTAYDICIKVKDSKGTIAKKYFTIAVNNATTSLKNTSKVSSTSVSKNTKVTITGASSGATDQVLYKYQYKLESDTSYTTISNYSTSTTASFTPSKTGTYTVRVIAQDMVPSLAVKTFTITVK